MEFPLCVNFTKKRGCARSALTLLSETADAWTFECSTCHLVWVVSKPIAKDRGRMFQQEEAMRKQAEARRAHDSRRKIFI